MNEQNKKRVRAAVFLLLALGLADAAYRAGMEFGWFHHAAEEARGGGMPGNGDPKLADASTATATSDSKHGSAPPALQMLPPNHKQAGGFHLGANQRTGGGAVQVASVTPDDPSDLLHGTGNLDISPSAGVPGTPPSGEGASGGGEGSSIASAAPGGSGGAGSDTGSGTTPGGSSGDGPVFGHSPTGGGSTGGGTTTPTDPTGPTDPTDPTNPTNPTDPTSPTGPTNPGGGTSSPIPEPSTWLMMAFGAAAIVARRRRQAR